MKIRHFDYVKNANFSNDYTKHLLHVIRLIVIIFHLFF